MRKAYIDNIRWSTVMLVVIYHVIYMYNAEGILGGLGKITDLDIQYYDIYQYIVYPWLMLILFIVSGICSRYYLERHTDREFIKSRTAKLLVPSTVGLFFFQFVNGYVNMSLAGAFDSLQGVPAVVKYLIMVLSGTGVLWYIQVLWLLSFILVAVRKIEKDKLWSVCKKANTVVLIAMTVVIWAFGQVLNVPIITVYRFGIYAAAFFSGYFVFSHEEVIDLLKKRFFSILVVAIVLGAAFCTRYFGENFADAPVNRAPLFAAYGWFACLAILGGMARFGDRETPLTRWVSKRSFGLYIFHYLGISAVALFIGKSGNVNSAVVYLISLLAGFAAGYGFNAIISKIPFLKWAVLGITCNKEKNVVQG